jgi:RNA polymerase sigma factor (sigma-70 family)
MRLLHNAQDSEDALREGLLSAFRHLHQFQGRAQFETWVHTIVVNSAKSALRKQRSRPPISSLDEPLSGHEDLCVADKIADPRSRLDDQYEQTERHRILAEAMQGLPPRWRVVIRLYAIGGLQLKEIAALLGLSISAVKSLHFRANRRLLKMVRDVGRPHQIDNKRFVNKQIAKPSWLTYRPTSPKIVWRAKLKEERFPKTRHTREGEYQGRYIKQGAGTII